MTREEALQAMIDGEKVTHEYFTENEYIYMIDDEIYTEEDYNMGTVDDEFWKLRETEMFEDGWEIYKG